MENIEASIFSCVRACNLATATAVFMGLPQRYGISGEVLLITDLIASALPLGGFAIGEANESGYNLSISSTMASAGVPISDPRNVNVVVAQEQY